MYLSLITFCKPCFVPLYYKRPSSRTQVVIIYLQMNHHLSFSSFISSRESAPTIIWVSRSWGLPRSTLFISKKAPSLWHFQSIHTISKIDLGIFPAVKEAKSLPALAYVLTRHEHYKHLSLCEHGLSST